MKNKVIKEYNGKQIYLVDERIEVNFGVKYKLSFWRTLDDTEHFKFECKIPEGKEDIDLATLKMDCINGKE